MIVYCTMVAVNMIYFMYITVIFIFCKENLGHTFLFIKSKNKNKGLLIKTKYFYFTYIPPPKNNNCWIQWHCKLTLPKIGLWYNRYSEVEFEMDYRKNKFVYN